MRSGLTLGSLFDGSGGFPLGGLLSGIQPVWASEVEPFPIRVTTKRLPFMKHYGDVSKMHGGEVEPVDIITFGSPCQDLSVAGKRAGLDGSRSNLFYEAVRIIKEMRCATDGKKPRFIVWENVPGAFSSNKGEGFKAVLEAVCKIKDETISVPKPNKWLNAGEILGGDYSLAWRVLDAQYWGVPQRRRRIFLVADFAGECAGKILFESEGMPGDSAESRNEGQGAAEDVERSVGSAIAIDAYNHAVTGDITVTLTASSGSSATHSGPMCMVAPEIPMFTLKSGGVHAGCYNGENIMQSSGFCTEPSAKSRSVGYEEERSPTLRAGARHAVYAMTTGEYTQVCEEKSPALRARDYKGPNVINEPSYPIRRLTPTECARLQGFPDWWCSDLGIETPTMDDLRIWYDIFETFREATGAYTKPKTLKQITKWLKTPHLDSAEYKMWGNGVALPCVYFVLTGIVSYTVSVDELVNSESEAGNG